MIRTILIAAVMGLGSSALAGYSQQSTTEFFYPTAKNECEGEPVAKDEEAEKDEPAEVKPSGPEPIYFGF